MKKLLIHELIFGEFCFNFLNKVLTFSMFSSEIWDKVNGLQDSFKILKTLSIILFVTISNNVSFITSKSMLEAVYFCMYDKIWLLLEGFFLIIDFTLYIASNIFPSISLILFNESKDTNTIFRWCADGKMWSYVSLLSI